VRQALTRVERIAAASESHRLDRHGSHAGFSDLDREVVLIPCLVGSIASLFVDADDVVHAAAMAGHADHGRRRCPRARRNQHVREHAHTRPAVEHDLLAPVAGKRARLERDRPERLALARKPAHQFGQLYPQLLLPLFCLFTRPRGEPQPPWRRGIEVSREDDRIELTAVEAVADSGERTDVIR
jgi:hypothetical protein